MVSDRFRQAAAPTIDADEMRPQFAMLHLGARLHYAAGAALAHADMLRALYTDACSKGVEESFLRFWPKGLQPQILRRWAGRKIPSTVPSAALRAYTLPSIQIALFDRLCRTRRKSARILHRYSIGGHWIAKRMIERDFDGANALYAHPCVGTEAVMEARRKGLFVVVEAISHPFNALVEQSERKRFGAPSNGTSDDELRDNIAFFKEEVDQADVVLAASPYVASGLLELGLQRERIAIVPYGLANRFFEEAAQPEPGRVLFVGNVGYLKGVPYLAEATRLLRAEEKRYNVRVVGPSEKQLLLRPEYAGPTYVGQVPRSEVMREFLAADVFVFPTLSDGFGIVLLEAMAAGLPVICTADCAALVRDGVNGFIVPARDPIAISSRVKEICGNRSLRDRLGREARNTAADHGLDAYTGRLVSTLHEHFVLKRRAC